MTLSSDLHFLLILIFIKFINKQVYMSVSYSRAPTNYSSQPPKTYKHTQECHFFVIDSENEEELQPKIAQSVELTDIE